MKKPAALLALGACALTVAACGSSGGSDTTSDTVRIGLEGPLSGDQKVTGVGMLNGAKLAAKDLNAKGGIEGKQVEIVPIDDAADADTGVSAANAAVKDGLDGVIGPYNSGVGIKTLPIYEEAGLVPIRLTSDSDTNGMGFTLQPMDYQIAPVETKAMTDWLKARKVAILYDPTQNYTTSTAEAVKKNLEQDGVKITAYNEVQPGEKSYESDVKKALDTDPDVVFSVVYFPEGGLIAKAMYSIKPQARCLADYASNDPGYVTTAGKAAAQACPTGGVPAPEDFKDGPAFVAEYEKEFGSAPGTWSPYTYDSLNFLAEGVKQAGGFDSGALKEKLSAVKDWQGVTGSVTIDPSNGNRDPATVTINSVDSKGEFHVDEDWAKAVGAPY
ncbi:MAG: branched-chain amino acid ABC transporter substrate-binding protein [Acidobacteria bacterium]|nr:branched-chain amino acid ABC transporter substrate-binding protein [Acidobacteriota bacterium]